MSKSYKHTPCISVTGQVRHSQQKKFQQSEHRAERRQVKNNLLINKDLPHPKEYGNEWASPRDGKRYDSKLSKRSLRK